MPPFKGKTPKQSRDIIKGAKGAYAWRQGQVGGEDVWHGRIYPYRRKDRFSLIGEPPKGAKIIATGKGSAYKTIAVLYGEPPSKPKVRDMGVVVVTVSPTHDRRSIKLNFKRKGGSIELGAGIVRDRRGRHIKLG